LTLVIDATNGTVLPTRYIESSRSDLGDAICDLRAREKTVRKYLGFIDLRNKISSADEVPKHKAGSSIIHLWLQSSGFEAVVWDRLTI